MPHVHSVSVANEQPPGEDRDDHNRSCHCHAVLPDQRPYGDSRRRRRQETDQLKFEYKLCVPSVSTAMTPSLYLVDPVAITCEVAWI